MGSVESYSKVAVTGRCQVIRNGDLYIPMTNCFVESNSLIQKSGDQITFKIDGSDDTINLIYEENGDLIDKLCSEYT